MPSARFASASKKRSTKALTNSALTASSVITTAERSLLGIALPKSGSTSAAESTNNSLPARPMAEKMIGRKSYCRRRESVRVDQACALGLPDARNELRGSPLQLGDCFDLDRCAVPHGVDRPVVLIEHYRGLEPFGFGEIPADIGFCPFAVECVVEIGDSFIPRGDGDGSGTPIAADDPEKALRICLFASCSAWSGYNRTPVARMTPAQRSRMSMQRSTIYVFEVCTSHRRPHHACPHESGTRIDSAQHIVVAVCP